MQMGVEINLGGHKYFITSERQQILDLLISTYEQAVHLNEELKARQQELANRTAQLEAINKELESFSYAVSHDLRAPLRHIDGFSQSLVEDCAGSLPPVGVEHLGRIRAAVKRMSELIEDLLQLSRVTRGEMKHESVNLSELAVAVLEELQRTQPERTVTRAVATGLVAEGDQRLIRVVLDNLLGNAWKYTQKCAAPVIEFGMTERDGVRTYYVKDNGAGFDMAYVGKLFAPFQRLHTVEEFPGTGIGLATVQRIIHRHGGRIWADGAVGQGATFSFTLG
jgi:light-regulated signal transduction histidine kinase (bacteriophytochrome)